MLGGTAVGGCCIRGTVSAGVSAGSAARACPSLCPARRGGPAVDQRRHAAVPRIRCGKRGGCHGAVRLGLLSLGLPGKCSTCGGLVGAWHIHRLAPVLAWGIAWFCVGLAPAANDWQRTGQPLAGDGQLSLPFCVYCQWGAAAAACLPGATAPVLPACQRCWLACVLPGLPRISCRAAAHSVQGSPRPASFLKTAGAPARAGSRCVWRVATWLSPGWMVRRCWRGWHGLRACFTTTPATCPASLSSKGPTRRPVSCGGAGRGGAGRGGVRTQQRGWLCRLPRLLAASLSPGVHAAPTRTPRPCPCTPMWYTRMHCAAPRCPPADEDADFWGYQYCTEQFQVFSKDGVHDM